MKRFLIFLLTATILYACRSPKTVQTDTPSYPNESSYPNEPSYPNDSPSITEPGKDTLSIHSLAPQPGDGSLERGNVFIENSEILTLDSYPIQVTLVLEGNLPTPCSQLRVIAYPPDKQNRIQIEAYSMNKPAEICSQVLDPFEVKIGLGSYPDGHYTVFVNEELVGEFDI